MAIFLGIDCGLQGGIAVFGDTVEIYSIPIVTEKKEKSIKRKYDIKAIKDIFLKYWSTKESIHVFIEKTQAFPGQGGVSMWSIGFGDGMYQGILTALQIPYEVVHPKKWQKEFSISGKTKSLSFEVANRLYPHLKLTTERGKILDGLCDALLIAEYGKRKIGSMVS